MQYSKKACERLPAFDFMPLGQAIKKARESRGITREQLAEMLDYAPRHLQAIENEGQHPSLQLFIQLVTLFQIPVSDYLFPPADDDAAPLRHQVNTLLNQLSRAELSIIEATARGILVARNDHTERKVNQYDA